MKYITALFVFTLFFLLDVLIIILCGALIGLFIVWVLVDDGPGFPVSFVFAKKIWMDQ